MQRYVISAVLAALFTASPVQAGYAPYGLVKNLSVTADGIVRFNVDGSTFTCAAGETPATSWSFSASTSNGQAMLAVVLTARSSQQLVFIAGASRCALVVASEVVESVTVQN